ncbi:MULTISPECIES: DUF4493 domain-containing protein [Parabacteroides]|uniref:DUF4493 domain-containing protein n=1 Tax=Parabacteroides provencensis TaxID=1944636 RepID=UPI000C15B1CD|nr:DUF4493 domain-containing protein [Parabacteroides provencensis]
MKSIVYSIFIIAVGLCTISCSKQDDGMQHFDKGTGGFRLKAPAMENSNDIPIIYTRSGDIVFDMQPETFPVSICNKEDQAVVKSFESFTALIEAGTPLVLPIGDYIVKSCSFIPASNEKVSEKPYFEGTKDFTIEEGEVLNTSVLCKFKSVGVELRLSDRFKALLASEPVNYDYKVTVSNDLATWSFDKKNMVTGYFLDGCSRLTVKVVVKMAGLTYPERTWYFKNGENAPQPGEYYIITLDAGKSELKMSSCKL